MELHHGQIASASKKSARQKTMQEGQDMQHCGMEGGSKWGILAIAIGFAGCLPC
jgi:hypothetical protein